MSPVEEMTLAESFGVACAQPGAGIENAIAHIDRPDREPDENGNPCGEMNVRHPGEDKCPRNSDRRRVQARQVPVFE